MATLVAEVDMPYMAGTLQLKIGDRFEPDNPTDEKLLVGSGRARYLRADEQPEEKPGRQAKTGRGKYNRSDMQADE